MFERFARDARAAVALAEQEARELGDRGIAPAHLLVGVVQSAGRALAAVLTGHGLTTEALRARLADVERDDSAAEFEADALALASIGIDLHAVHANVIRRFGAEAFRNAAPRTGRRRSGVSLDRGAKRAVEAALGETSARRAKALDCPLLLLGILDAADPLAVALVGAFVDPTVLRAEVEALADTAVRLSGEQ